MAECAENHNQRVCEFYEIGREELYARGRQKQRVEARKLCNILVGSGIGANGNIACEAISADSPEYCPCRSKGRKDSPGEELPTAELSYWFIYGRPIVVPK